MLPPELIELLQGWYTHLREDVGKTATFQEKTQRHEYHPEILSTYLNLALVPFASTMSQSVVAPTYPFPITYVPGGSIHPHLDVSDNELSLTFQVGCLSRSPSAPPCERAHAHATPCANLCNPRCLDPPS